MSGIEAIFGILSAGMGAMGAIAQGQAAADAAEFNAKAAEQQAASERDVARVEAADYKRDEMRKVSSARTARLATGVTMAGSPLLVDEATVREVALGAQRYRHAGAVRGNRLQQQADLDRMRGEASVRESYYRAGTSLLGGFGNWMGA